MNETERLEKKIYQLQESVAGLQMSLNSLMQYVEQRDNNAFEFDFYANLYADFAFEMMVNPDTFFDK